MSLTPQQTAALKEFAEAALQSAKALGMPPRFADVSLAQAILESGWGKTVSGDNNVFGIKFDHFNVLGFRNIVTHETIHGVSQQQTLAFQNYASVTECFQDHARIFLTGALAPKYKAWVHGGAVSVTDLITAISPPSQPPNYATALDYKKSLSDILQMNAVVQALAAATAAMSH
jgi:flagellum-specific peptidoglycan hydrolase FlgJ